MTEITSFASIPAIMAICYFVSIVYRWIISDDDGIIRNRKAAAFKPVLCGSVGLFLGIITYYTNPDVIHSDNVLAASATGITSGLASVGVHKSLTSQKQNQDRTD